MTSPLLVADGVYPIGPLDPVLGDSPLVHIPPGFYHTAGAVADGAFWYLSDAYGIAFKDFRVSTDPAVPGNLGPQTIKIPNEAWVFETNGFETWERVGDILPWSVRMPDHTWRRVDIPYPHPPTELSTLLGDRSWPYQLKLRRWLYDHATGEPYWLYQEPYGRGYPLRIRLPGGVWYDATTFNGLYERSFGGRDGSIEFPAFGGYVAVDGPGSDAGVAYTGWYVRAVSFGAADPEDWSDFTEGPTPFSSSYVADCYSQAYANTSDHQERDMRRQLYLVELETLRWADRVFNPDGSRHWKLRIDGVAQTHTVSSIGPTDTTTPGEIRLHAASLPTTDFAAYGQWTNSEWMLPGRNIIPRDSVTGRGTSGDLLHTFTNPDPHGDAFLMDLDLSALTGQTHLDFEIVAVPPDMPTPTSTDGSLQATWVTNRGGIDITFTLA